MGLDAVVHCNCAREGKARPHPFPELLAFDETGEATLKSDGEIDLKLWVRHDDWYRNSCAHAGQMVEKRLGNVAAIAHIREFLESNSPKRFRVLLERVVYDGSHAGDRIAASDAAELLRETKLLQECTSEPFLKQFAKDMAELAEASAATGNPIVF
jgi:hypothetical protein